MFSINFQTLRKLVIKANRDNDRKEAITSLEVLQYLQAPCL